MSDPSALRALFADMVRAAGPGAKLRFFAASGFPDGPLPGPVTPLSGEQTNRSFTVGGSFVLKVRRAPVPGVDPEREMLAHLTARGAPVPELAGGFEIVPAAGPPGTVGLLTVRVDGEDAWSLATKALRSGTIPVDLAVGLGRTTARLHLALADARGDPAFAPEPEDGGLRIRVHGDYHLGQAIVGAGGIRILDFEGEPERPLAERRAKESPLRDVAGMLRSFHYAACAAGAADADGAADRLREAFWEEYQGAAGIAALLPPPGRREERLRGFLVAKAVYEVEYERRNRPGWVSIARRGLERERR